MGDADVARCMRAGVASSTDLRGESTVEGLGMAAVQRADGQIHRQRRHIAIDRHDQSHFS